MSRLKKEPIKVLIEEVDYPDRAKGVEVEIREFDAVDRLLEIDKDCPYKTGRKIRAKGGIPGQVYQAIPKRRRKGETEVRLQELIEKSKLEGESSCPSFPGCGGCYYQTLPYSTELFLKGGQLQRLFDEAGFSARLPIHPSPSSTAYRNKMEYSFGNEEKDGPLTLGLHKRGHFYDIVPTPDCQLVPTDFNRIRSAVQDYFRNRQVPFYNKSRREGYLRYLVLRASLSEQELMVNLVTTSHWTGEGGEEKRLENWQEFCYMLNKLPLDFKLVSILHTIDDAPADAVVPEEVILLEGRPYLRESLAGLSFHVSPFSFFQPNAEGAAKVYRKAIEYAGDLSGKTVFDLYCGTGTMTQLFAQRAQRVIGIEIVEEAVEKAEETAALNQIVNARFIAGDVLKEMRRLNEEGDYPNVIVVDPPRSGLVPSAIQAIVEAGPEKIIYVSCNPRTQVRDLQLFAQLGYPLVKAQAFDQFPRTANVECVALMSRDREEA